MEGMKQDEKKLLRINSSTLEEVNSLVNDHKDIYASASHFIRCAVRRLIDYHKKLEDERK